MSGVDLRHSFLVIIPVADRPQHLTNILASLRELLGTFGYGGTAGGRCRKIAVVVADDSADAEAIRRHREIAAECDASGLPTTCFGAAEQAQLLQSLPPAQRAGLRHIIGEPEVMGFQHKGASVTRNLAYLLAQRGDETGDDCLFMFVDSDEQFKVRSAGPHGDADAVAIDYFGCLDRIFSTGSVDVLTGKVVGDPPVSPAVMAGTLLSDLLALLQRMAAADPGQPCTFHDGQRCDDDGAAYHDMADLFGFAPTAEAFDYHCPLGGDHDHAQCFADLAARLDRFFDGEHLTRSSAFRPAADCLETHAARTVYTGNYVCTRAGLKHFIPFAPLKLRMAGPVLGRLIRAEIGDRFVSANLPLLHTRTTQGDAGYRPGVSREAATVDLSGEFERQFFGDVMLFAIEALLRHGYPVTTLSPAAIKSTLQSVEAMLSRKYSATRATVMARLDGVRTLFDATDAWWNRRPGFEPVRNDFQRFFDNIRRNFGDDAPGLALIRDGDNRAARRREIAQAIANYADDRQAWAAALATLR